MGLNVLWSRHNSFLFLNLENYPSRVLLLTCLQMKRQFFISFAYRIKNAKRLSILFFFSFQFTLRKLQNNSSMFTKKNVVGTTEI